MKTIALATCFLALMAAPVAAGQLKSDTKTFPAGALKSVSLEFPVGEVEIRGSDRNEVAVTLVVHCDRGDSKWCGDRADRVELNSRTRGNRLLLDVAGHSWFDLDDFFIEVIVDVPRRLAVDLEMNVGEVTIEGLENHLDVNLKVGEITVYMPEDRVRSVYTDVGIGEATMDRRDGQYSVAGFLGRKLRWNEGKGTANVDIHLGIGELSVLLK